MNGRIVTLTAILGTLAVARGQNMQRRAVITGGGDNGRGKCTIEVVVDGTAEVEIRGGSATLRNLTGQTPQWRRFECTSMPPANPARFEFAGVDGRGRQQLVRDPRNGGVAVVRIEDPQGGAEGYTFDITWDGVGNGYAGQDRYNTPRDYQPGRDVNADRQYGDPRVRGIAPAFSSDQAVGVCQDAVRRQAIDRFNGDALEFRRTTIEDNPGPRDRVSGTFMVRRRGGREEVYRFNCSVNFDTGQVRSADITAQDNGRSNGVDRQNPPPMADARSACQRAVSDRIRRDGYQRVEIGDMNVDNRSGRDDRILGWARGDGNEFDFVCSVNLQTGVVRSVDVRGR